MRLNCINLVSTEPERLRSFYAMILQKPYNEIVPGHMNLDKIAEAVKAVAAHPKEV